MIILTSPAKTLDLRSAFPLPAPTKPIFPHLVKKIVHEIRDQDSVFLQKLLSISPSIAQKSYDWFMNWQPEHTDQNSRPAIATYKGDVYRQLQIKAYSPDQVSYLQNSLRIISGLYGVVRPLDRVQPYRLEMGTSLRVDVCADLYTFWKKPITDYLINEIREKRHTIVLNLASQEYAKVVDFSTLPCSVVHVFFQKEKDGKRKTVGILAKRARGMMIDYCVRHQVSDIAGVCSFQEGGYILTSRTDNELVFVSL